MRKNLLLFVSVCCVAEAAVVPNPLFSDGMVIQREQPVRVWGNASDGEKVTVEFAGQKIDTVAVDGAWQVSLKAIKAGGPHTMKIAGDNAVSIENILIGDVWLCSGQSNMHFRMKTVTNAEKEIAGMQAPEVRFFTVSQQFGQAPLTTNPGSWQAISPQTAAECSAVSCYFGASLQKKLDVPIGLIISSVGGTRIESWMRRETLAATGESQALIDKWKAIRDDEFQQIGKAYTKFQYERDHSHPQAVKKAKEAGEKPPSPPVQPKLRCHDCPSALHNGMIQPLEPLAIRGVIWYQGESNAGQAKSYEKLLPAMIGDWRKVWGKELPFLFVQIAPHNSIHPSFREAQLRIWQNTPNTAMAATTDVGNMENIHPTFKRPVGERLALAARAVAYKEPIQYSGPVFQKIEITGNQAKIDFDHVGIGLVAKNGILNGFTVVTKDGKCLPAKAEIQGTSVIVSAEGISSPQAVQYNWAKNPDGNLYNRDGLPALPFRTGEK